MRHRDAQAKWPQHRRHDRGVEQQWRRQRKNPAALPLQGSKISVVGQRTPAWDQKLVFRPTP
jgi:hypothetical protein